MNDRAQQHIPGVNKQGQGRYLITMKCGKRKVRKFQKYSYWYKIFQNHIRIDGQPRVQLKIQVSTDHEAKD